MKLNIHGKERELENIINSFEVFYYGSTKHEIEIEAVTDYVLNWYKDHGKQFTRTNPNVIIAVGFINGFIIGQNNLRVERLEEIEKINARVSAKGFKQSIAVATLKDGE